MSAHIIYKLNFNFPQMEAFFKKTKPATTT